MDPRPICFTCWVCLGSSMRQPSAKDMPAWLFEENWKMYRIQRVQEDLRSQAKLTSACLSTSSHLCTLMPSQPSTFVTSEQKHCATGRDSVLVWLSYLALQIPNCGWTTEGFLNRKRPRLRMMIICLPWFNLQISIGQPSNPPKPPRHQGVDDQQLEDSISLQRGHSIHYLAQFRAGMGHNWPILSWFGHCGGTQALRGT